MKIFHRKPSANFPQTSVWGITATRHAIVIALGLHDLIIELPKRKTAKDAADYRKARGVLKGKGIDPVEDIRKLRGD